MSLDKLNPALLRTNGASDGDALIYSSANARLEFGSVSISGNDFYANDYNTYTSLQSEYSANDFSTYTTLLSRIDLVQDNVTVGSGEYRANDFATYTSLQSEYAANDFATLLSARSNDFATYTSLQSEYRANDHNTYTSLLSSINSVQSNLTSVIGSAPSTLDTLAEIASALENDANIAVTLITAIDAVQSNVSALPDSAANDFATLLSARSNDVATYTTLQSEYAANDYATYISLLSSINTVQANTDSLITLSGIDVQITDANLVPSANNIYSLGSPDRVWKDLYLSGNSLVIGNTVISESTGGGITISAEGSNTSLSPGSGNVSQSIAEALSLAQEAIDEVQQINSMFKFLSVEGQSTITAESLDTLNIAAGNGIVLSTNANSKTLTITASDVGSGSGTSEPIPGVISLSQPGPLTVLTGVSRWYSPASITVSNIISRLNTAADSNVTTVIKKNSSAISVVTILANQTAASNTSAFILGFGDYLTVDITSVGSTNKGEYLNIQFIYEYN
jgi:hypothetical protein